MANVQNSGSLARTSTYKRSAVDACATIGASVEIATASAANAVGEMYEAVRSTTITSREIDGNRAGTTAKLAADGAEKRPASKQGSTSKLYKVKKGAAIKSGSDRVSIKNADTVNNPLVNLSCSTVEEEEGKIATLPHSKGSELLNPAEQEEERAAGGSAHVNTIIRLCNHHPSKERSFLRGSGAGCVVLLCFGSALVLLVVANPSSFFHKKMFWLWLVGFLALSLFICGKTEWFKGLMKDEDLKLTQFGLLVRCIQSALCLAPVADMATDILAAMQIAQNQNAPSWWFPFSLVVIMMTFRGDVVLKYYTVMVKTRAESHGLGDMIWEIWTYGLDELRDMDMPFTQGLGGSFSFWYIPLALVPGGPYCCLQHSVYNGWYTAASEEERGYFTATREEQNKFTDAQKEKFTEKLEEKEYSLLPLNPLKHKTRTALVGLCTELLVMPATVLAGPFVVCWESFRAIPEVFAGKVADPAPQPFEDKLRIVLILLFQFLDGVVEALPQTGLQVHAYWLGYLSESVFFPSLLLSTFNILKTVYAFYENRLLIQFVEEANSGKLTEQAAENYINSGITSLNLVGANLGVEGARAVAIALKSKVFIFSTVPIFSHVCSGFIQDIGSLLTFTFSGDYSSSGKNPGYSLPVTMETTMTEADFSGKKLGISGGMMVAAFLPKCQ
jgi:hypothetical protein